MSNTINTTIFADQPDRDTGFSWSQFGRRLLKGIERSQMRRFERELSIYNPDLYRQIVNSPEYRETLRIMDRGL